MSRRQGRPSSKGPKGRPPILRRSQSPVVLKRSQSAFNVSGNVDKCYTIGNPYVQRKVCFVISNNQSKNAIPVFREIVDSAR